MIYLPMAPVGVAMNESANRSRQTPRNGDLNGTEEWDLPQPHCPGRSGGEIRGEILGNCEDYRYQVINSQIVRF